MCTNYLAVIYSSLLGDKPLDGAIFLTEKRPLDSQSGENHSFLSPNTSQQKSCSSSRSSWSKARLSEIEKRETAKYSGINRMTKCIYLVAG